MSCHRIIVSREEVMKKLRVLILASIILFSGCFRHVEATPYVWVADTMQTVMSDEKPGTNRQAKIWAARGEYEPIQIVVSAPAETLTDVELSVSDLKGSNGFIDQKHIEIYREHYVRVEKSSPIWRGPPNLPLGAGLYPDALIPLNSSGNKNGDHKTEVSSDFKSVKKGKNQPYWIDIFVPRDMPAGEYSGVCTIKTAQGSTEIDIHLTVWNFELPHRPSLRSMFGVWENHTNSTEVLLKHKLMPWGIDINKIEYYDRKFGINTIGTDQWSGADVWNPRMSPAPPQQTWTMIEQSFPQEFRKMLCNYTADEIDGVKELIDPVKEWGRNMHTGSSIKNLVTMVPIPELYDDGTGRPAVDIWALLSRDAQSNDNKESIRHVMSSGCEVWSYTALLQDNYSPKWLVDFPPINFRIQAWINQVFGFTGLLYWRVDQWSKDPWSSFGKENEYPGGGMLVYPGGPVGITNGVVPSVRLKHLRESVEDYEYIEILKSMGETEFALDTVRSVARDWKDWTRDEKVLMSARNKLGERIHYLKSQKINPDK